MGNHFRTSGADAETPLAQPSAEGTRFATPDTERQPQVMPSAQSGDAPQPAINYFATTSDEVASTSFAAAADPAMPSIPDPMQSTATHVAPAAVDGGLFDSLPDPMQPASEPLPEVTQDQAAEVANLDNALNSPEFTSVFAPIDAQESRKKMARQAGVEPVILMEHVSKVYPAQPNKPALDDINIEIYPGEFVFLVGHSGSGKTTLLSTLNRDVKPTSGRILVAGQDLMRIKNRKVPFLRRQIGAVFQDFKLLPQKTAYENVAFALQCIGKPKAVIRSQVPEVLRLVGLADQMDSLPDQLSGGEQQRVAVARAMVNRPPLLICDEPTGNLDPAISLGIMKLLERINRTGTTVIVATHDREMVDSMHRRVIALEGGHVIRDQERGGYGNYGTN